MKKSMLLSTIAMIVVVVVALSTATFAWFSSFESVTTEATLTINAGSAGIEVREAGASAQWTNTLAPLTASALSPVAPKTDITAIAAPSSASYTAAVYTPADFFSATKKKNDSGVLKFISNGDATANTNYIFVEFQVRNASTESQNIALTATVVPSNESATDQDKYAVNNTKIVMTYAKGISSAAGTLVGSTFKYQMTEETDDLSMNKEFDTTATGKASTNLGADNGFTLSTDTKAEATVTLTAANNTSAEWYTIGVYIWIDGHTADNYAAGASLKATISVTKA